MQGQEWNPVVPSQILHSFSHYTTATTLKKKKGSIQGASEKYQSAYCFEQSFTQ